MKSKNKKIIQTIALWIITWLIVFGIHQFFDHHEFEKLRSAIVATGAGLWYYFYKK